MRRHGRRTYRAKILTSSGTKRGFFTRQDFIYDAERDHYTCPAGAKLTKIHRRADHTEDFDRSTAI